MNQGNNTRANMKFVFFGSSEFSVYILDELKLHNLVPDLIITTPDKPKGRKLILTPTPVKVWGQKNNIEVLDPASLKNNPDLISKLKSNNYGLFLVASYGKIIPKEIFEIPKHKTLNIHPSLLPKYRGASPIQAQILNDEKEVGATIMEIVEEMDAGPIVAQKKVGSEIIVTSRIELEKTLAVGGAQLFAKILPDWLSEKIEAKKQEESQVTFCKKIEKTDGEIDLSGDAYENYLKIKAYEGWPGTFFFKDGKRIKITQAEFKNGELKILKIIPEGKKEMLFSSPS